MSVTMMPSEQVDQRTAEENAHVLIIDDEQSSRMILSQFFTKHGCHVVTAENGQEGIETVRKSKFNLIMLDINMPVMAGNEALPQILDVDPEVRVIIMTANASYDSKVETREMGAYDYLVKPITMAKLQEIYEKAIPERRQAPATAKVEIKRIHMDPGSVDRETAQLIPERMSRAFCLMGLYQDDNTLTVAMVDPFDIVALDTLQTQTGFEINPVQADRKNIIEMIEEVYGEQVDIDQSILELVTLQEGEAEEKTDVVLKTEAEDAPVIQLVNLILQRAVESGASDIHIEPEEKQISVRLRIDGIMQDITAPPKHLFQAVVSRVKIMGYMDIAERRIPQDGRARIRIRDKQIDLRINTLPTVYGESVVMRLLDQSNLFADISQLGLSTFHKQLFIDAIMRPHGMIYLTGPTGSGKTTTLYSGLQHINSRERKIITVEDPVEYELSGINQVHVHADIGLTFANVLRAMLRQDPDAIMVGETRDRETAEIAVRAALTGHLVFSTLHTNDAPSSITRLIDLGIEPFLICSSLNLIIAQRLVRRICDTCKTETQTLQQEKEQFAASDTLPPIPDIHFVGGGCEDCRNTGYKGRIAIHEFLPITGPIRQIIMHGAQEIQLKEGAVSIGCTTLLGSGIQKVAQGETTLDEVLRIALHD